MVQPWSVLFTLHLILLIEIYFIIGLIKISKSQFSEDIENWAPAFSFPYIILIIPSYLTNLKRLHGGF